MVLNAIATQKAQKRYDEYYDKQYAAYLDNLQPTSTNIEVRIFEEVLKEALAELTEPEYNPPVVNNAHEKLFNTVMYPICLFFVVWLAMCFGGCVYLLI